MKVDTAIPPHSASNWLLILKDILKKILKAIGGVASHLFNAIWPHVADALKAARDFATEHPWCTAALVALVLSMILALPVANVVAGLIGFASPGIRAGSIAARIQSIFYGGFVPAGSIFAFLQSFGAL